MSEVGRRVRLLRTRKGLTLKELSERTGVSVSMLSMLERGVASASVGTLVSVASALGAGMADLFEGTAHGEGSPVRRKAEQPMVETGNGTSRRVAHQDVLAGIELAVNEYQPGGSSGDVATHHEGRELGVVVGGTLQVEVDGMTYDLSAGDAIAYSSASPHRISNRGRGRAVAVWVNITQ